MESIIEKWIYFIKNAGNLAIIPKSAEEIPELKEAYTQATMHTWSLKELEIYEYWQIQEATDKVVMERQFEKGVEQGIEQGIEKVALNMKAAGITVEVIMQATGLSREKIVGLKT